MKLNRILSALIVLCIAFSGSLLYAEAHEEGVKEDVSEEVVIVDYDSLLEMKDKLGLNEDQVKKITDLRMKDKENFHKLMSKKEKVIQQLEAEKKKEKIDKTQVERLDTELRDIDGMIKRQKVGKIADLQDILTREQMEKFEKTCAKPVKAKTINKNEDKPRRIETEKKDR